MKPGTAPDMVLMCSLLFYIVECRVAIFLVVAGILSGFSLVLDIRDIVRTTVASL
jgi:hypothetical protein